MGSWVFHGQALLNTARNSRAFLLFLIVENFILRSDFSFVVSGSLSATFGKWNKEAGGKGNGRWQVKDFTHGEQFTEPLTGKSLVGQ